MSTKETIFRTKYRPSGALYFWIKQDNGSYVAFDSEDPKKRVKRPGRAQSLKFLKVLVSQEHSTFVQVEETTVVKTADANALSSAKEANDAMAKEIAKLKAQIESNKTPAVKVEAKKVEDAVKVDAKSAAPVTAKKPKTKAS